MSESFFGELLGAFFTISDKLRYIPLFLDSPITDLPGGCIFSQQFESHHGDRVQGELQACSSGDVFVFHARDFSGFVIDHGKQFLSVLVTDIDAVDPSFDIDLLVALAELDRGESFCRIVRLIRLDRLDRLDRFSIVAEGEFAEAGLRYLFPYWQEIIDIGAALFAVEFRPFGEQFSFDLIQRGLQFTAGVVDVEFFGEQFEKLFSQPDRVSFFRLFEQFGEVIFVQTGKQIVNDIPPAGVIGGEFRILDR